LQLSPESTTSIPEKSKKKFDRASVLLSRMRSRRNLTNPEGIEQIGISESVKINNSP